MLSRHIFTLIHCAAYRGLVCIHSGLPGASSPNYHFKKFGKENKGLVYISPIHLTAKPISRFLFALSYQQASRMTKKRCGSVVVLERIFASFFLGHGIHSWIHHFLCSCPQEE